VKFEDIVVGEQQESVLLVSLFSGKPKRLESLSDTSGTFTHVIFLYIRPLASKKNAYCSEQK
jgi:hypothetical protein